MSDDDWGERFPIRIFGKRARFDGIDYDVFGREDGKKRTIFPIQSKHPEFDQAEPGTEFKVKFQNIEYTAVKKSRWEELGGVDYPCLTWERKKKSREEYRSNKNT